MSYPSIRAALAASSIVQFSFEGVKYAVYCDRNPVLLTAWVANEGVTVETVIQVNTSVTRDQLDALTPMKCFDLMLRVNTRLGSHIACANALENRFKPERTDA